MSYQWPLRFFKSVLDVDSPKLRMPPKFIDKLKTMLRFLPGTSQFRVETGEEFNVEIVKLEDGHYFSKGWPEFRDHFNIGRGYVLLFEYNGKKTWDVSIFDLTTLTIEYGAFNVAAQLGFDEEELDFDEERYGDEAAALSAANAYVENFPVGVTYFMKKMVKSFLTGDCVLAKIQESLGGDRMRLITVRVVGGSDVQCMLSVTSGRARLVRGWKQVVINEGLNESDQVLFKVGRIDPTIWDAIIFRV